MADSLIYSLVRVLVDLIAVRRSDQAQLGAKVLVLRCQVQVLERQMMRVRWRPGDRMIMAAMRNHFSRSAWAGIAGQAGDGACLASGIGAPEVGGLSQPAVARPAAEFDRVPPADRKNGAGESPLGQRPDSRRAPEAGLHGCGDHDQIGSARRWYSRQPVADLS